MKRQSSELERDAQEEAHIGSLQWHGCYFGPRGAIALGEQYYFRFFEAPPQLRLWAYMSLASLYYSAAGSAGALFRNLWKQHKFRIFEVIKWARASYALLKKSWHYAQKANSLTANVEDLQLSCSDYDVLQSIARKYYRTLWWNKPHGYTAKVVLGFATHSIQQALRSTDCTDISRCLLLIGHADLMYLQIEPQNQGKLRIAIFDTLLEAWDIAMNIAVTEMTLDTKRQLARVFRHIKEMCGRLIPFHKEVMPEKYTLYPSSAEEMLKHANLLMLQYLGMSASEDQALKAGVELRLPPSPSSRPPLTQA